VAHPVALMAIVIALSVPLAACSAVPATGPAETGKCPLGYHTEAFPNDSNPRHAYQCWPDQRGYLRSPGDEREQMAPSLVPPK
jgi:hypothetical protein